MAEDTSDKQISTSESKKRQPRTQGWIRMHTDETTPPPADEQLDAESQPRDRKARKELENQIE